MSQGDFKYIAKPRIRVDNKTTSFGKFDTEVILHLSKNLPSYDVMVPRAGFEPATFPLGGGRCYPSELTRHFSNIYLIFGNITSSSRLMLSHIKQNGNIKGC